MSNFYTILTNIGAALHANAQVQQTTVPWTHMALGDGNGNPVVPQQTQAGLVREVHRLPITSLEQHPDNPNWIVVEAVVPSDVGGWTVRETALYGGAGGGSCIAVGNYPATYKPVLAEGAAREMVMRMVIEVSSVATVKLVIDPAVAIASRKWVESLVATPAKAGLVKLATVDEAKEGLRGDVAVTPEGLDAALSKIQGLPLFLNGWHDGTRAGLLAIFSGMATPQDGIQLSALTHPHIVKGVLAGHVASCTEAEWQADAYNRGMWSRGTAYLDGQGMPQGWVRGPDRNGVQEGSLPAQFWRGGADAKVGSIGKDTMREISAEAGNIMTGDAGISGSGAMKGSSRYATSAVSGGTGSRSYSALRFNASDALPEGHVTDSVTGEFAPWHVFGCYYTITSNGVVNEGALDAAGLSAEILLLQGRVATLEGRQKALGDGQTWQNLTGSRALNTNYTNTTGRAIALSVFGTTTAGVRVLLDGVDVSTNGYNAASSLSTFLVIPAGAVYRVEIAVTKWMELR